MKIAMIVTVLCRGVEKYKADRTLNNASSTYKCGFPQPYSRQPFRDLRTDCTMSARQIVLCFDGTGNTFRTDGTDTNVLKICRMLEKSDEQRKIYLVS